MNTANLQLEGLLLAVAALIEALKKKGLLTPEEVENALRDAKEIAGNDAPRAGELSHANAAAVLFPIRFLLEANNAGTEGSQSFSALAERVGRTTP